MSVPAPFLSFTLPELGGLPGAEGWYYAVCALVFVLAGAICGYMIWRKGHMQTLDAEAEVRRAAEELERLKEDLKAEERGLEE